MHLLVLGCQLALVAEILEAAAAAGVVGAGGVDPLRRRLQHLGRERLGEAALHLRHPRADAVAGKAAADEDDEPVQAGDAVAAVGERVDAKLDLVVFAHGRAAIPARYALGDIAAARAHKPERTEEAIQPSVTASAGRSRGGCRLHCRPHRRARGRAGTHPRLRRRAARGGRAEASRRGRARRACRRAQPPGCARPRPIATPISSQRTTPRSVLPAARRRRVGELEVAAVDRHPGRRDATATTNARRRRGPRAARRRSPPRQHAACVPASPAASA